MEEEGGVSKETEIAESPSRLENESCHTEEVRPTLSHQCTQVCVEYELWTIPCCRLQDVLLLKKRGVVATYFTAWRNKFYRAMAAKKAIQHYQLV